MMASFAFTRTAQAPSKHIDNSKNVLQMLSFFLAYFEYRPGRISIEDHYQQHIFYFVFYVGSHVYREFKPLINEDTFQLTC